LIGAALVYQRGTGRAEPGSVARQTRRPPKKRGFWWLLLCTAPSAHQQFSSTTTLGRGPILARPAGSVLLIEPQQIGHQRPQAGRVQRLLQHRQARHFLVP
jgi:hypothetical protein